MAFPSITYTFVNSTTADATQVNRNFTDLINGVSDGVHDIRVNDASVVGNLTLSNALSARTILPGTADLYDLGSAAGAWNNVWANNLNVESAVVSGAGHVAFRAVTNYIDSDTANYLDLHAADQIRANGPMQVSGSFVASSTLHVIGAQTNDGATTLSGPVTINSALAVAQTATVHSITPAANDTYNLGNTNAERFGNLNVTSALVYTNLQVGVSFGATLRFATANEYIVQPSAGRLDLYANGGSGLVAIQAGTIVPGGTVYPATNSACDLGASSNGWKDLYVKGTAYMSGPVNVGDQVQFDTNATHYISGTSNAMSIQGGTLINIGGGGTVSISGAVQTNGGSVVINSGKAAYDLDVHGNSATDVLCVKGTAGQVGILKSTPSQALDVLGTIVGTNIGFRGCTEYLASYASGSFEGHYTGVSTLTTLTFYYVSVGKMVTLYLPHTPTCLSTATTFSLPAAQMPAAVVSKNYSASDRPLVYYGPAAQFADAGASAAGGVMVDADAIMFTKGISDTAWTNSGAKSVDVDLIVTYLRD